MAQPIILLTERFMKTADEVVNIHAAAVSTTFGRLYFGTGSADECYFKETRTLSLPGTTLIQKNDCNANLSALPCKEPNARPYRG